MEGVIAAALLMVLVMRLAGCGTKKDAGRPTQGTESAEKEANTGAETRYYIDTLTVETYAAEFVPEITEGEEKTDESFNIREYLDSEA